MKKIIFKEITVLVNLIVLSEHNYYSKNVIHIYIRTLFVTIIKQKDWSIYESMSLKLKSLALSQTIGVRHNSSAGEHVDTIIHTHPQAESTNFVLTSWDLRLNNLSFSLSVFLLSELLASVKNDCDKTIWFMKRKYCSEEQSAERAKIKIIY